MEEIARSVKIWKLQVCLEERVEQMRLGIFSKIHLSDYIWKLQYLLKPLSFICWFSFSNHGRWRRAYKQAIVSFPEMNTLVGKYLNITQKDFRCSTWTITKLNIVMNNVGKIIIAEEILQLNTWARSLPLSIQQLQLVIPEMASQVQLIYKENYFFQ